MPSKTRLAIDPGAAGGLAWRDADGVVQAMRMPDTMPELCDQIRALSAALPGLVATVERVGGYVPGNSGPAACKFARYCGHIDAALYMAGVPCDPPLGVAPQTWQKWLGALPADKPARKRAIRDAMARLHPHMRVTLDTADALAILGWAERGQE
jgi:hypothetical protein